MEARSKENPSQTGDPHMLRRKLILAKHPEIKSLMVVDPYFKWQVLALVFAQIGTVFLLRNVDSLYILLFLGYFVTGIISHALFIAIHEIVHDHAFGPNRTRANIILGMVANLPLIFPVSVFQKQHHPKHHRHTGIYGVDPETPSDYEKTAFRTHLGKIVWMIAGPFFTAFNYPPRGYKKDEKLKTHAICNTISQFIFTSLVAHFCGLRMAFYLIFSFFVILNFHPIAGERLSDHSHLFKMKDIQIFEERNGMKNRGVQLESLGTFSYYGPINKITFNAGYHVEHHDFPSIPGSKLPLVRKIAPEFYNSLPYYTSRTRAIWNFITEPSFGPWSLFARADPNVQ